MGEYKRGRTPGPPYKCFMVGALGFRKQKENKRGERSGESMGFRVLVERERYEQRKI